MEIEVGEHVRTEHQGIGKVERIEFDNDEKENYYFLNNLFGTWEREIIKHSKNIIDLIEKGDYVNREQVIKDNFDNLIVPTTIFSNGLMNTAEIYWSKLKDTDIRSIVTKEQFKSVEYEVK